MTKTPGLMPRVVAEAEDANIGIFVADRTKSDTCHNSTQHEDNTDDPKTTINPKNDLCCPIFSTPNSSHFDHQLPVFAINLILLSAVPPSSNRMNFVLRGELFDGDVQNHKEV
jgi:hypothetical protein